MEQSIIFTILKSLFLTTAVAITAGLFFTAFNIAFLYTFSFVFVLQFVGFYFYGEFIKRKNNKLKLEAELKLEQEKSKQYMNVVCPCDRQVQSTIPINLNERNNYTCHGCDKDISVYIEAKTALTTIPVLTNPLDTPLIMDEVKRMIEKDGN